MIRTLAALLALCPLVAFAAEGHIFRFGGKVPSSFAASVQEAGGTIREHGEFVPGEPYMFFTDPDGYEVEIWYELPTSVDPRQTRRRPARVRRLRTGTR